MTRNTARTIVALLAGATLLGACKDQFTVPDLNNLSAQNITGSLNRSSVQLLTSGVLNRDRIDFDERYLVFTETMGRDFVRIDPAENRWITEMIGPSTADPGGFTGSGVWTQFYAQIRAANTLIDNLHTASDLTTEEQSAVSGLVKTFKALAYYRLLATRDSLGIPVDVDRPINAPLAPFVCKPNALAYVAALLDSAYRDLQAGGASFPVVLPAGFTLHGSFDTPATFAKFNRGLAGKIDVYRAIGPQKPDPTAADSAIAELNASFIDPTGNMNNGIYYVYSTASGETQSPFSGDNAVHLNASVGDSVMKGDARASKIITASNPYSGFGVSTPYDFAGAVTSNAANQTRPIAILKNSELLLLRAQAEIQKGDLVSATADINAVHTIDGGLPPYPVFTSAKSAIDAVLYEKRYSLLGESESRLVDLRAYGRFNAANLGTTGAKGDIYQSVLPVPKSESDARGGDVTPVCQ